MSGPRVVLVGPPGAGKSTVGQVLAEVLGAGLRDTDARVEDRCGMSVAEVFVEEGEAAFRAMEHEEVVTGLLEHDGVLSLGGGAVLDPRTEQALAGHRVVFLDVAISDAAKRVGFDRSRPLLGVNPRAQWVRLMEARRPIYERVAALRLDTTGRTPAEVASVVVDELGLQPEQHGG